LYITILLICLHIRSQVLPFLERNSCVGGRYSGQKDGLVCLCLKLYPMHPRREWFHTTRMFNRLSNTTANSLFVLFLFFVFFLERFMLLCKRVIAWHHSGRITSNRPSHLLSVYNSYLGPFFRYEKCSQYNTHTYREFKIVPITLK